MTVTDLVDQDDGFPSSGNIKDAFKGCVEFVGTCTKVTSSNDIQGPLYVLARSLSRECLACIDLSERSHTLSDCHYSPTPGGPKRLITTPYKINRAVPKDISVHSPRPCPLPLMKSSKPNSW